VRNWRSLLRHGAELGDADAAGEAVAEAIEARLRTGRPLAVEAWIAEQERRLARPLARRKPGPRPKGN
jgi:putative transposase